MGYDRGMQITLDEFMNSALALHQNGRLAEAEAAYRQILEHQPDHAQAWSNLGMIFLATSTA